MDIRLNRNAIEHFMHNGYLRVENAFSKSTAAKARDILWQDTGCDPSDRKTWIHPVVRLGMYSQEPFRQAANTPVLLQAFDKLVGHDRWIPIQSLGAFPVRFPSTIDPGDTGWHVDASFPGSNPADYFQWRINIRSKGRALLALFLFSDVSDKDAPTRLRIGSHLDIARLLFKENEEGLSFMEVAGKLNTFPEHDVAVATGEAGTVYLCHPFIVHGAQLHDGNEPRFMAQPPLILKEELNLNRRDANYSPLEQSVRMAIL